jgi:hypothetical protein
MNVSNINQSFPQEVRKYPKVKQVENNMTAATTKSSISIKSIHDSPTLQPSSVVETPRHNIFTAFELSMRPTNSSSQK